MQAIKSGDGTDDHTFSRVYTPVVVGIAFLLASLPPLLGLGEWSTWLYRALTFLVISYPCALAVSVPMSFFGGLGEHLN